VQDLVPFARTDILPLGDERWEVLVEEGSDEALDAVLHTIARWAAECRLPSTRVLVDDEPVELPDAD
jgi:hypothetical protein